MISAKMANQNFRDRHFSECIFFQRSCNPAHFGIDMDILIGRPQLFSASLSRYNENQAFCAPGSILAFSVPCFLPRKAALQPTLNRSQLGSNFTEREFPWNAVDLKQFPRAARPGNDLKSNFEKFRRDFAPDAQIPSSQRKSQQSPP